MIHANERREAAKCRGAMPVGRHDSDERRDDQDEACLCRNFDSRLNGNKCEIMRTNF